MDSGWHGGISFNGRSDCHTVAIGIGGDGQVDGSVLIILHTLAFGSLVRCSSLGMELPCDVRRVESSSRASRLN